MRVSRCPCPRANGKTLFESIILAAVLHTTPNKLMCTDKTVGILQEAGFKGESLREAWAIVMRESRGHQGAISPTNDYGLFQMNRAAHHKSPWWDDKKLLKADYNAAFAYHMSQGGKNWSSWDIGPNGEHLARWSPKSVYDKFVYWLKRYPC